MEKLSFDSRVILRNGVKMPRLGFGCEGLAPSIKQQVAVVREAMDVGYRLFDTAMIYHTERAVGEAIKECGIPREKLFISTKIWNTDARRGIAATIAAVEDSLRRLNVDYLDRLILHWPVQGQLVDTWRVMEGFYYAGKARSLGLSNVKRHHHLDIMKNCDEYAHVQQDAYNPIQRNLYHKMFCDNHEIQYEAFQPIVRGRVRDIPILNEIGEKYGKSPFQVVLRWDLQCGVCTVPRSSDRAHMAQNADIFDFELTEDEVLAINAVNTEEETNWDTENFNF